MYKNNLDWKKYEAITKYIYESLGKKSGVEIICYGNTCKVKGKSGVDHQIDVLASHSDGIHDYKTAIECKYWKEKINKDIVMKVSEIIEDAGINKGVIVSKSGFTPDGISFAKYRNIGLIELREIEKKDFQNHPKEIHIADIVLKSKILIKRPQILNINIGNNQIIKIEDEWDYYKYSIILKNQTEIPLIKYVNTFREEVNRQNKKNERITKSYVIPNAVLFDKSDMTSIKINKITFTGQLIEIDASQNFKFKFVDHVWLIMKAIFEEKIFTFSESGVIVEYKRKE